MRLPPTPVSRVVSCLFLSTRGPCVFNNVSTSCKKKQSGETCKQSFMLGDHMREQAAGMPLNRPDR